MHAQLKLCLQKMKFCCWSCDSNFLDIWICQLCTWMKAAEKSVFGDREDVTVFQDNIFIEHVNRNMEFVKKLVKHAKKLLRVYRMYPASQSIHWTRDRVAEQVIRKAFVKHSNRFWIWFLTSNIPSQLSRAQLRHNDSRSRHIVEKRHFLDRGMQKSDIFSIECGYFTKGQSWYFAQQLHKVTRTVSMLNVAREGQCRLCMTWWHLNQLQWKRIAPQTNHVLQIANIVMVLPFAYNLLLSVNSCCQYASCILSIWNNCWRCLLP